MTHITPPKYVISVLKRLECHGYKAFLVGGCVRDMIMGRRPNDWDICTDAKPEQIMEVFQNSRPTGIKHGTVTVIEHGLPVEVTTFRSDGVYIDHRRPESVSFISDLSVDLERRDFTMNAIALPISGLVFDPFGGKSDIDRRLIRCVGTPEKRFKEDALRMLRALRFSAVLGFAIEGETMQAIKKCSHLSKDLAAERVCAELEKVLMSDAPEVISKLIELGLLCSNSCISIVPTELSSLRNAPKKRQLRWCALCALLLKANAITDAEAFLQALRLDSATVHNASTGCQLVINGAPQSNAEWKKLLSRNGTDCGKCAAAAADTLFGNHHYKTLASIIKSGDCYSLKRLEVTGDDLLELGYKGPALGAALYELLDHVIYHPSDNKKSVLLELAHKNKN